MHDHEAANPAVVYLRRNDAGQVVAISLAADSHHSEACAADHAEVVAFVRKLDAGGSQALAESDLDFVRVLEDVIELLVRREILRYTDLPESAQSKLLERRRLRHSVSGLKLLDEDTGPL